MTQPIRWPNHQLVRDDERPEYAQRIERFLSEAKTGKITLNVKDGKILVVDFQESIRL